MTTRWLGMLLALDSASVVFLCFYLERSFFYNDTCVEGPFLCGLGFLNYGNVCKT